VEIVESSVTCRPCLSYHQHSQHMLVKGLQYSLYICLQFGGLHLGPGGQPKIFSRPKISPGWKRGECGPYLQFGGLLPGEQLDADTRLDTTRPPPPLRSCGSGAPTLLQT